MAAWSEFAAPLAARGIPWIAQLGNHDDEAHGIPRAKIMEHLASLPASLCRKGPFDGSGDVILDIADAQGMKPAARLYCLYSGAYSGDKTLGTYGWIHHERIQWYRQQAGEMAKRNRGALPALAFFHIPLPEYREAVATSFGCTRDDICSPEINSGMFAAMIESKDVMGVFVGHDHISDFAGWARGICLAYGRKTGDVFSAYGKPPLPSGCRIIVLHEGERRFDTWIRNVDGTRESAITYPDSFQELMRSRAAQKAAGKK